MPSTILGPEWQPGLSHFFSFLINDMFLLLFWYTLKLQTILVAESLSKCLVGALWQSPIHLSHPVVPLRVAFSRNLRSLFWPRVVFTSATLYLGWLTGWTHWSEGWATPGEPSFNPRNRGLEGQGPPTTPSALGLTRNELDMAMDF